jgi:tripartite-type tricarboxylate transporter receptor subunit TctC
VKWRCYTCGPDQREATVKRLRRRFLHLAAGAAALPAVSRFDWAQTYPSRPVRLIVGFTAGTNIDIVARLIGQWLSERLGQPFIIENRPGASGNLAAEAVVRAPPDGYTLLMVSTANAINATLYENLNFNFIKDIAPIASLSRTAGVMEVSPSFPAKTVPEFIAYAKANPGKIMMASAGPGSAPALYGELFKALTGVDIATVSYRGSASALSDLIAGHVQVMFDPIASSIGYIKAAQLRPLGVTTAKRIEVLSEVPTIGDFVPGYEASGWQGIGAPANTPPEIIAILNKQVNEALAGAEFKARFVDLGLEPFASSPTEFGKFIVEYTEKWGKVIRAANIKPN